MIAGQSPSNRRRRRIVATVAVLVIGLSWWFWPRVDQRFVGIWYVIDANDPTASVALGADGLGLFDRGGRVALPLIWWVDGDVLVIEMIQPWRWRFPEALGSQADKLQRMIHLWRGDGERWTIVTRDDGEVELHSPTPESGRVLRKVNLWGNR